MRSWVEVCVRRTRGAGLIDGILLCISGVANGYFYRRVFRCALSLRDYAADSSIRGKIMTRFMGASGAESLNVAAVFSWADGSAADHPPILPDLTRSELMTVMTSGMAHVSGGIMAAYIAFGIEPKHC